IGPFYPGLQVYNVPHIWSARNLPMEVLRTIPPLPGIRLRRPRHINAVHLVVTLVGPPGTLPLREGITRSFNRWRAFLRFTRNANSLVNVNEIGVPDMVI